MHVKCFRSIFDILTKALLSITRCNEFMKDIKDEKHYRLKQNNKDLFKKKSLPQEAIDSHIILGAST